MAEDRWSPLYDDVMQTGIVVKLTPLFDSKAPLRGSLKKGDPQIMKAAFCSCLSDRKILAECVDYFLISLL